jgi:CubicO group peptidase (beta-lactamase class C family)
MNRTYGMYPRPQVCDTAGCGATATGAWTAYWSNGHLCCDACAPWHNTAMPLPAGFAYRSLGPVPPAVPHTTGHLGVASTWAASAGAAQ